MSPTSHRPPADVDDAPARDIRRALETGNETLVITAARELPRVRLDDALRICLVLRGGDPDRYERAAVRWLVAGR